MISKLFLSKGSLIQVIICVYLQAQNASSEGQQQTSATEQSNTQGNNQQQIQPPQTGGQAPPGVSGAAIDKLPPQRYTYCSVQFVVK